MLDKEHQDALVEGMLKEWHHFLHDRFGNSLMDNALEQLSRDAKYKMELIKDAISLRLRDCSDTLIRLVLKNKD